MPDHASGQPLPEWVTWACCDQVHDDGTPCTGAAQSDYGRCVTHLDYAQLVEMMTRRPDELPPDLDARGVRLSTDSLKRVLRAARNDDTHLRLGSVFLAHAVVRGSVFFRRTTVEGDVSLDGATVEHYVSFLGETVRRNVSLRGATVKNGLSFHRATVGGCTRSISKSTSASVISD